MTINWKNIIEIIKEELKIYNNQGYKPTVRSIFYRLHSKNLYQILLHHIVLLIEQQFMQG